AMPGSRCSKSPSWRTSSVPPFLPSSDCVAGLANPSVPTTSEPLEPPLLLELLEPHADSSTASRATAAKATAVLIDLIESPPVVVSQKPSSGLPRVQGVSEPVSQKIESQHRDQQRDAGEDHVPPRGVEDRRRR